jgi:hypothetical protein
MRGSVAAQLVCTRGESWAAGGYAGQAGSPGRHAKLNNTDVPQLAHACQVKLLGLCSVIAVTNCA